MSYCFLKTDLYVSFVAIFIHHSLCVLGWRGMERRCWPAPGEGRRGSRRARSTLPRCQPAPNPATPPPPRPSHRILREPATTNMCHPVLEWKLVEASVKNRFRGKHCWIICIARGEFGRARGGDDLPAVPRPNFSNCFQHHNGHHQNGSRRW